MGYGSAFFTIIKKSSCSDEIGGDAGMINWCKIKLSDCCEIISGSTPSTNVECFWNGSICWATPKDLSQLDGAYISDTPRKLTQSGLDSCGATILPSNSVLFSSRAPIGHVAVNTVPMATNQGFKSFVPKDNRVYAKFLYHWLRKNRAYLESLGNGATFKEISKTIVSRVEILLPPLEEQKRIAEILDQAEELRAKRREAIAQLNTLTQSIFLEMFGDPILNGWKMETVAEIVHPSSGSIRTGPFGSQLLHSEFVTEGIAVLGIDNAVANEFRWGERRFISELKYSGLKRYTVKPGDVIITIMGTCGRCAVVPDNIPVAINTKHLCCITIKQEKCLPRFLHAYFLLHPIARQYLNQTEKGAIMAGLNMGIIKSMPIFLPPLHLQQEFSQRVEAVEKLKAAHRASLSELDALFASLQHRAFKGDL